MQKYHKYKHRILLPSRESNLAKSISIFRRNFKAVNRSIILIIHDGFLYKIKSCKIPFITIMKIGFLPRIKCIELRGIWIHE